MPYPTFAEEATKYNEAVEGLRRTAYELAMYITNNTVNGIPWEQFTTHDEEAIYNQVKLINAAKRAMKAASFF